MFDISWGELVLIGMVALIVIGPKELPTVLRTVGQWMTKVRRMASEFQGQFQEAMREAEFSELKKQVDSISDPTRSFAEYNPLETVRNEMEQGFADKPADKPLGDAAAAEAARSATGAADTPAEPTGFTPNVVTPEPDLPPYALPSDTHGSAMPDSAPTPTSGEGTVPDAGGPVTPDTPAASGGRSA